MTSAEATYLAALIAAGIAAAGLLWSVASFALLRRSQRATDAREQWSRRFEQAQALAFSADAREARTGILLIERLTKDPWVTDEDRATAVSVLTSLAPADVTPAARVRTEILGSISDPAVALELSRAAPGPRGRFEVYQDSAGGYRWRLKFTNGEVGATSESYTSRRSVLAAIESVRRHLANGGEIRELP